MVDLTEALRASVEAAKKTPGRKRGKPKKKTGQAGPARNERPGKAAGKKPPTRKKAGKRPARKRAA